MCVPVPVRAGVLAEDRSVIAGSMEMEMSKTDLLVQFAVDQLISNDNRCMHV